MDKNDKAPSLVGDTSSSRAGLGDSDVQFDLRAVLRGLRRRRKMMAIVTAGVFAVGMLSTVLQRPSYESTTRLLISSTKRPGLLSMAGLSLPTDLQSIFGSGSVETEAEIVSDDQLLQTAYERLSAGERKAAFGGKSKLPDWAVKVGPKRGTDVLEIRVESHSPKTSAHLANNIVGIYFEKDFDDSSNATRKARKYAQSKMQLINRQLAAANRTLTDYKRRSHLVAPDAQLQRFTEYEASLQTGLGAAVNQQAAAGQEIAELEHEIFRQQPNVISGNIIRQNPRFATSAQTLDQLYSKRIEMLQEYLPQSPEIRTLDTQIKQEEARLKQISGTILDSETHSRNPIRDTLFTSYASAVAKQAATQASIKVLQRQIAAQNKIADTLPEKERQLIELQGQVELLARAYGLVSDQYYGLLLAEQQSVPRAKVISEAIPNTDPVSPSLPKNAVLFFALGAIVALAAALVSESLDGRIHEPHRAEQASGYFASAVVPMVEAGGSPYIARSHPSGAMLDSFRVLRNNIYFAGIERRLKTLAVTSVGRGDGKTLTCANLAAVIAMDGKTVVTVDCNMDTRTTRALATNSYDFGLTDLLSGGCDLDKAIIQGEQDNAYMLPSGPAVWNFSELLNSERGRKTFAQLAERFDFVLIDCASVAYLADLQMISNVADGLLLVVRMEKTLALDLSAATESLAGIAIPVVGLVANGDGSQCVGGDLGSGGRLGNESATGKAKVTGRRS